MGRKSFSQNFAGESEPCNCVIVDDHRLFAESLKFVLEQNFSRCHCTIACNAQDALQIASQDTAQLFLVDVHLPDMSGVELTRRIFEIHSGCKVIMLTVDDTLETVFQAIASGANGYLLKTSTLERICKDLSAILEGDLVISAEILPRIFERLKRAYGSERRNPSPVLKNLSPREMEVLHKVAQGKDNQTISQELYISEKTVKNHVARILEKLGVPNRLQLIVFAIQEGILNNQGVRSGS
ncbi:MAG: response regulator transcription factor [Candidatus Atribacteria bacterium]|nr:response regulator transcription factor [Candidatus Atribacteria bacterium]